MSVRISGGSKDWIASNVVWISGIGVLIKVRNESTKGSQNFRGDRWGSPLKFLLLCSDENLCELVPNEVREVLPGPF